MALAAVAHSPPSRAVFGAFPPLAAAGIPHFSLQTVSKVSQLSRAKASIVETINYGERGISHACLYSLRDHHLGCNRPRRLRGTSRESRRRRAVEAQLNYDEIALLTISPASANPGRFLGRGLLASRRCRSALSDSSLPADISAGADRAAVNVFLGPGPVIANEDLVRGATLARISRSPLAAHRLRSAATPRAAIPRSTKEPLSHAICACRLASFGPWSSSPRRAVR